MSQNSNSQQRNQAIQQNTNNQQTNQVYTKEDAYQNLEMINTWISSIDTKVSFALALVCCTVHI